MNQTNSTGLAGKSEACNRQRTLNVDAANRSSVWLNIEDCVMMHAADSLWDGLKAFLHSSIIC